MAKTPTNKSVEKAITKTSYRDLITMSDSQVQAEQVDFSVERAENSIEKAILDVKGQYIDKMSAVKSAELKVSDALKAVEKAKRAVPLDPNALIRTFQAAKQADLDLEAAQEDASNVLAVLDFLQVTQEELFPNA